MTKYSEVANNQFRGRVQYNTFIKYPLLSTDVDVLWRPVMDDDIINDLKTWTTSPYTGAPDFILFGTYF